MTEAERSALRGLVAQQVLFLCEERLGLKVDAESIRQVAELLVSGHEKQEQRDIVEEVRRVAEEAADGKGEVLVNPSEFFQRPSNFDFLMKFQYGDAEESDRAFEELQKRSKEYLKD